MDQTENFLLRDWRRVVLRADQLDQLLDEFLLRDQLMQAVVAILHARFQNGQRVHDALIVLRHRRLQPFSNRSNRVARPKRGDIS